MSLYKDKFEAVYQDGVGFFSDPSLHKNSQELVSFLQGHNILKPNMVVFEMGAAGCRNLKYLLDAEPTLVLRANDLHAEASFKNMHESVKDKIEFFEKDTLSLVDEIHMTDIDILLASDHFMHIDGETIEKIQAKIALEWKPKYILLREVKPAGHKQNRTYPRLCHYFHFLDQYTTIDQIDSATNPDMYYVQLLVRDDVLTYGE